jgi:hypothetical protein
MRYMAVSLTMHQWSGICDPIYANSAVEISDICGGTTIQYDDRMYLPHDDSKQDGQMLITGIHSCRRQSIVPSVQDT